MTCLVCYHLLRALFFPQMAELRTRGSTYPTNHYLSCVICDSLRARLVLADHLHN